MKISIGIWRSVTMPRQVDRFMLLLWKNWKLQRRKPISTVIEILIPILLFILLVYLRTQLDPEIMEEKAYRSYCPLESFKDTLFESHFHARLCGNDSAGAYTIAGNTLLYSPNTTVINGVMEYFKAITNVYGLPDTKSVEDYYSILSEANVSAAIQFDDKHKDAQTVDELLKDLKVSIRFPSELRWSSSSNWATNLVFPTFLFPGPRNPSDEYGAVPYYFMEGFLSMQHYLTVALTLAKKQLAYDDTEAIRAFVETFPTISMQRYPYPEYYSDTLIEILKTMFPLYVIMGFVYAFINTVKSITAEKEKQLKEVMKIMGLPNWLHWSAWFTKCFFFFAISSIIMIVLLKATWFSPTDHAVLTRTSTSVLFVFFLFYITSMITFCFAYSVFFSKANNATTVAGLAWFLSYTPYIFVQQGSGELTLVTKLFISLCHNSAMSFGLEVILKFEGNGEGVNWGNLFNTATIDDNLSVGLIILMFAVDSVIYLLIALYIEAIFPGEFGMAQPWYFIFTKNFWCGEVPYSKFEGTDRLPPEYDAEFFEKDPTDLKPGIRIQHMTKQFGEKVAVNQLSLNMYEDQITVLLGHNGAGKTTTMSMLTGMISPSDGTAIVNDFDIKNSISKVRASLGLCPQHNVIFDELTVYDHLYFFSRLKGLKGKELNAEIKKYLKLLALEDKKDSQAKSLSGGMKRKLCVGIALCGGSKVIMLDEPTAGMDPSARRVMWELIQSQKAGRTILLTTHFMDEADLLGDRIAIMAGGELQCCGSSFFLKKKYGAGYSLVVDKTKECRPAMVTNLLRSFIPDVKVQSDVGSELTYLLAENQSTVFENMLGALEQESGKLGVRSYGISLTTLEEVFMKVGADHDQEKPGLPEPVSPVGEKPSTKLAPSYFGGSNLIYNQFLAMFLKRIISIQRSPFLLVCQFLIPPLLLIVSILSARGQSKYANLAAMPLDLSKFSDPVTYLEDAGGNADTFATVYKNIVTGGGYVVEDKENISQAILAQTSERPSLVRSSYIIGAAFRSSDRVNMVAYFNNDPYHSPGVALGYILNAFLKVQAECEDCYIDFINHPLPFSSKTKVDQLTTFGGAGFQITFNVSFAMIFVSAFYVLFVVRERITKSKHLQFVSGIRVWIFWTTTFIVDMITYLVTMLVIIITLAILQEDGLKSVDDLGRMFLILLYYGWSCIPLVYILGYWFKLPSTGFGRIVLIGIMTGSIMYMMLQIFQVVNDNLKSVADKLHWLLLLSPFYSFASGVSESYTTYNYYSTCNSYYKACAEMTEPLNKEECLASLGEAIREICEDANGEYFRWESPGIGRNLVFSFLQGPILFALILIIDYELLSQCVYYIRRKFLPSEPVPVHNEDSDVVEERERVMNNHDYSLQSSYILLLKDLTKYYKKFLAVNGLCLGVKEYECFGLLGVNGAGKTTTFKMMTGDEAISHGDGWVHGLSIKSQLKKVQKLIGYCPQFDALLDDMTGRETIIMYGLIRGIPLRQCRSIPDYLGKEFDFRAHLDKRVKQMSGGNKRKLSTALSLIGDPPLLYLDEPTTGMDPATKRYLWNALCKIRDSGKSIILTSHSMEECEALCTRLAIMVGGNFKCLGSTQHLKSKFADGYSLVIKIRKAQQSSGLEHSSTAHVESFVRQFFPSSELKEKHEELLFYHIRDKSLPWSKMFGILEQGKRGIPDIEDYSLSQSTLEQVFLTFTGGSGMD